MPLTDSNKKCLEEIKMEMEYSNQNNIRMGDPNRNKFAKTSFILSLISIILSPISIIQILGIVFGILGLKSEKKGLSLAGLVISIITMVIGIVIIISIASLSTLGGIVSNARENTCFIK